MFDGDLHGFRRVTVTILVPKISLLQGLVAFIAGCCVIAQAMMKFFGHE